MEKNRNGTLINHYLKQYNSLINQGEDQKAYAYYRYFREHIKKPKSKLFQAEFLIKLNMLSQAEDILNQLLENEKTQRENQNEDEYLKQLLPQILMLRGQMYSQQGRHLFADKDFEKAKELISKDGFKEKKNVNKNVINELIIQAQALTIQPNQITQEIQTFQRFIKEKNETQEGFTQKEGFFYLISMKWFNKYQEYLERSQKLQQMNDQQQQQGQQNLYMECIDQADILLENIILIDPDDSQMNYIIKPGLKENFDYMIISAEFWTFLFDKYKGIPIRRNIIQRGEVEQVEVYLKKISIAVFPSLKLAKQDQIMQIYISHQATIRDLLIKIVKIYKKFQRFLFKELFERNKYQINAIRTNYEQFSKLQKNINSNGFFMKTQFIFGKSLSFDDKIDEAQISEDDIIVIEVQNRGEYKIEIQKLKEKLIFDTTNFQLKKISNSKNQQNTQDNQSEPRTAKNHIESQEIATTKQKSIPLYEKNARQIYPKNLQKIEKYFNLKLQIGFSQYSTLGLTGLNNLGNTCFMNSGIQCIANIHELSNYFLENRFVEDLNFNSPLGAKGLLAGAWNNMVYDIWQGNESAVAPWNLKKVVGAFYPQFSGYSQQDSLELIAFILDRLHEDLNRIKKKPYIESKDYTEGDQVNGAIESWTNYLKRNNSILVDICHGQFQSKLTCPDCSKVSLTFDPYSFVPLPIPSKQYEPFSCYFLPCYESRRYIQTKFRFSLQNTQTTQDVLKLIADNQKNEIQNYEMVYLKKFSLDSYIPEDETFLEMRTSGKLIEIYKKFEDVEKFEIYKQNQKAFQRIRIEIWSRDGWFTSGSQLTQPRLIYINKNASLQDLNIEIFKKLKLTLLLQPYMKKNKDISFNQLDKQLYKQLNDYIYSDNTTDQKCNTEYQSLMNQNTFKGLLYELKIMNNKKPKSNYCILCKKKCGQKNCILSTIVKQGKIIDLADRIDQHGDLVLHIYLNKVIDLDKYTYYNKYKSEDIENKNQAQEKTDFTLYDCLDMFGQTEKLSKSDPWYCPQCQKHVRATKKIDLDIAPDILILQLKRFKTKRRTGMGRYFSSISSQKLGHFISFPIEGLDLTNYLPSRFKKDKFVYDLFAVSNHYGSLSGGHYTAYCKNICNGKWFHFDDSRVSSVNPSTVQSRAAYVLFYRKRQNI